MTGVQTPDSPIDRFCIQQDDVESENDLDEEEEGKTKKSFKFPAGGDVDYGAFGGGSDDDDDDDDDDDKASGDEDDEDQEQSDAVKGASQKILRQDLKAEVTKGLAIKQQLTKWDSLFECRIQIQKVLSKINQYPQPDKW